MHSATKRVLIIAKTYPELSAKYGETVCTAAVDERGTPLRLYPIPFRYLSGPQRFKRYQWISASLSKSQHDTRPESHTVGHETIKVEGEIPPTPDEWGKRADFVLKSESWQYTSMEALLQAQRDTGRSLAFVRPALVTGVTLHRRDTEDARNFEQKLKDLKDRNVAARNQLDLFERSVPPAMKHLEFMEGRVCLEWRCSDANCNGHSMQILDWEICELARREGLDVAKVKVQDPVLLKSDMVVHPDAAEYVSRRLGVDSQGLGDNTIGKALLKANREGKGLLLFGSPFHVAQEGLRALMTGVSPFGIDRWDLSADPVLRNGVENGLTLGKDYRGLSAFTDGQLAGHSALLSKVPVVNRIQSGLNSFLFDRYIPSLKSRAYRSLVGRYTEAYPDWAPDKVAQTAAADTNERFGGINYKRLGRAAATQNWFKLAALAPDWIEGEARAIARPFGMEGKIARVDMLRAVAGLWGAARVLNYLTTGNFHNEAPFGVAVKGDDGKEKIYSIRTLPTDMLHAVSDPVGFVQGRFSPLVKTGTEVVSGRDDQGRKLQKPGLAFDLLRSVAPIPLQTAVKTLTGATADISTPDQVAKAAGLTVYPYKSEAQRLADTLASDRNEGGPVDPAKLRQHRLALRIEESARLGEITPMEISQLARESGLAPSDFKAIETHLKETRNMDPEQAGLYLRAARLPMPDFLKVYDAATVAEKNVLQPLLLRKSQKYITNARKEMTVGQQASDPTLQRLQGRH